MNASFSWAEFRYIVESSRWSRPLFLLAASQCGMSDSATATASSLVGRHKRQSRKPTSTPAARLRATFTVNSSSGTSAQRSQHEARECANFSAAVGMSGDINLRSGSIVTEKGVEMSLLDTIEPALEIDPGGPVPPVGVTNLEKFLRAGIPVIMFQKVAVSVLLGRASCLRPNSGRPVHSPEWRGC